MRQGFKQPQRYSTPPPAPCPAPCSPFSPGTHGCADAGSIPSHWEEGAACERGGPIRPALPPKGLLQHCRLHLFIPYCLPPPTVHPTTPSSNAPLGTASNAPCTLPTVEHAAHARVKLWRCAHAYSAHPLLGFQPGVLAEGLSKPVGVGGTVCERIGSGSRSLERPTSFARAALCAALLRHGGNTNLQGAHASVVSPSCADRGHWPPPECPAAEPNGMPTAGVLCRAAMKLHVHEHYRRPRRAKVGMGPATLTPRPNFAAPRDAPSPAPPAHANKQRLTTLWRSPARPPELPDPARAARGGDG